MGRRVAVVDKEPLSLIEQARIIPGGRQPSDWLSRLPVGRREEVKALLQAKASGEVALSVRQLVDLLISNGYTDATITKVSRAVDAIRSK